MSFKVNDKELLKNYIKIWENISNLMNIKFDSGPYCGNDDKYIKAKVKLIKDKACTNFCGKGMPKKHSIQAFAIDNIRLY